jgi:hypothetical protein
MNIDKRSKRIEEDLDAMSFLWKPGFVHPSTGDARSDTIIKSIQDSGRDGMRQFFIDAAQTLDEQLDALPATERSKVIRPSCLRDCR